MNVTSAQNGGQVGGRKCAHADFGHLYLAVAGRERRMEFGCLGTIDQAIDLLGIGKALIARAYLRMARTKSHGHARYRNPGLARGCEVGASEPDQIASLRLAEIAQNLVLEIHG